MSGWTATLIFLLGLELWQGLGWIASVNATIWNATSGPVTIAVDTATFEYAIYIDGRGRWLAEGQVAMTCDGLRYSSGGGNLTGGPVTIENATDSTLGCYTAIKRTWFAADCSAITTSIREYSKGGFEFVSEIGAKGARGTATGRGGNAAAGQTPATEFPSLVLPNLSPPLRPPTARLSKRKVGCSDGSCEGFCNHPNVHGCGATWTGATDLRKGKTGSPCGGALPCVAAADACAPGWGLCLSHSSPGLDTKSFLTAMDPQSCSSSNEVFVAAMSYSSSVPGASPSLSNCSFDNTCRQTGHGAEPLCCGAACKLPPFSSALWPNKTRALIGRVFKGENAGSCAALTITRDCRPRGVLCCKKMAVSRTLHSKIEKVHVVPSGALNTSDLGFLSWEGNSLHSVATVNPPPADLKRWQGGMNGGPLVLYTSAASLATDTIALVIGPSSEFKTAILSRVEDRLVGGAHGIVAELPANFTLRFAFIGRTDGITSAMYAYGSLLRQSHGTDKLKLPLSKDPLSRQLHYVTDGGSLLNYCDYTPQCESWHNRSQWPGGPIGCTPMSETFRVASEYHKRLKLNVSLYHVDPYWFSHLPAVGGPAQCTGAMAANFTASPWHFPNGLKALGLPMMLFLQGFAPNNIYSSKYQWAGQSVHGNDAARFFSDRFAELTSGRSECSALTVDGVNDVFFSDISRLNNTWTQTQYDKGLADAALEHSLPIRIDQQL